MSEVTLEVLAEKIDNLTEHINKMNGTNERQWNEISTLKIQSATIQAQIIENEKWKMTTEERLKNMPDVRATMLKFSTWMISIIGALLGLATYIIKFGG